MIEKRKVEILILSDIHLGTIGSRAKELYNYLESIEPQYVVLNGDIIDMWQFRKRYFPSSHLKILRYFFDLIAKDIPVVYITGNHDEMLRKFVGTSIGSFTIVNKLVLQIADKKIWIFHGDVFDVVMQYSKWLAKLGSFGYDLLIFVNTVINNLLRKLGKGRISISQKVKNSVKTAVKYVNDFELTAAKIAINNSFNYVICGHIHQPANRKISNNKGEVTYLNSGDWVENMTSLEYANNEWMIFDYNISPLAKLPNNHEHDDEQINLSSKQLFTKILNDFKIPYKQAISL